MDKGIPARVRQILQCPKCGGSLLDLDCENESATRGFRCRSCALMFPIIGGVPRMLIFNSRVDPAAESFGFQWRARDSGVFETETLYGLTKKEELLAFFNAYGISAVDLKEKTFLDAGCGDGALLGLLSGYGADIVGMDINISVDITYRRCEPL